MKWALRIGFLGVVFGTLLLGMFAVTWRPQVRKTAEPEQSAALIRAAGDGDVESVNALLDEGTPPDATDVNGRSALWWAVRQGHGEVVLRLVDAGADQAQSVPGGETPLSLARDLARVDPSNERKAIVAALSDPPTPGDD
jgi:hypothetical protein